MSLMDLSLDAGVGQAVRHEMYAMDLKTLPNGNVLLYAGRDVTINSGQIAEIDLSGKIVNQYFTHCDDRNYLNFFTKSSFAQDGNELLFLQHYDPFIYYLGADEFSPKFRVDFGSANVPDEYFEKPYADIAEFSIPLFESDFAHGAGNLMVNSDYLTFNYLKGRDQRLAIYDKETGKVSAVTSVAHSLLAGAPIGNLKEYGIHAVSNTGYFLWLFDERPILEENKRKILSQSALKLTEGQIDQYLKDWERDFRYVVVLTR